jgi:putative glycerol-1-phosphate prenyltransferase
MTWNLKGKKSVALLLDPDSSHEEDLKDILSVAKSSGTDYIFVGGSLTFEDTATLITRIKSITTIPVILFPGNLLQLNDRADGILLLSLISGRNPELLIGNHVVAAPFLRRIKHKVIPVGYILINCGSRTSVEYMSQTDSIPSTKEDIAVATALAGEMLGLSAIYLEAGSGAEYHVPSKMIRMVRDNIDIPIIVGGGIRSASSAVEIFKAGADIIVVGNGCENNLMLLNEICQARDSVK